MQCVSVSMLRGTVIEKGGHMSLGVKFFHELRHFIACTTAAKSLLSGGYDYIM